MDRSSRPLPTATKPVRRELYVIKRKCQSKPEEKEQENEQFRASETCTRTKGTTSPNLPTIDQQVSTADSLYNKNDNAGSVYNNATTEPILPHPFTTPDVNLVQESQKENPANKRGKRPKKPHLSTDLQLYSCCGHMNRLVDRSQKPGSHVWNKFDDQDGPLNLNVVLDEFRASIYGLSFSAMYGLSKFHLGLVMFDWAHHVTSAGEAPNKLCTRTFKDNSLFPWDVYQVPVYQEFQFSNSANLSKLLITDKDQRSDHCKSFMAALLWRYFPHCCGFTFPRGSISFGKGQKYPYVCIISKCENPVCQLSITLLIPTLPLDDSEPVKFVLFVNHNRTCAFQSWWYPYAESSFASSAQEIGNHCPHCIVDQHVTKLSLGNFALENVGVFANSSFLQSKISSMTNEKNLSLLDLFCYIKSGAMAVPPYAQFKKNICKKYSKGKQKEGFVLDKAKIHAIIGTLTLDCNVIVHDRYNDICAAPQAAATIWGVAGHLHHDSIRLAMETASECGSVVSDEVSLISKILTKNISYLHMLPSLQQSLTAVPSVDSFLKLVPCDMGMGPCTCKQIIPGREVTSCVLHGSISLPERTAYHKCPHCPKAFPKPNLLKSHIRTHTGEKPFVCTVCLKKFRLRYALKKHRYIHSGQHPFACNECGQGFAQPSELRAHRRLHTGEKPFRCNMCGRGFAQSGSLTIHKQRHKPKSTGGGSVSIPKPQSTSHAHHPNGSDIFSCVKCDDAFTSDQYLQEHTRRMHKQCIVCPHCSKTFPKPSALQNHLRTHTGERPFVCGLCGKGFKRKDQLKIHNLSNHSAERPFACDECGRSFPNAKLLEKHMPTHTADRPFKCDMCPKRFRQKSHLKTHHGFMHSSSSERPFVCDDCGYGFVHRNLLFRHILTHTGKKTFKCNQCDRAFVHPTSLTTHKQNKHMHKEKKSWGSPHQ